MTPDPDSFIVPVTDEEIRTGTPEGAGPAQQPVVEEPEKQRACAPTAADGSRPVS